MGNPQRSIGRSGRYLLIGIGLVVVLASGGVVAFIMSPGTLGYEVHLRALSGGRVELNGTARGALPLTIDWDELAAATEAELLVGPWPPMAPPGYHTAAGQFMERAGTIDAYLFRPPRDEPTGAHILHVRRDDRGSQERVAVRLRVVDSAGRVLHSFGSSSGGQGLKHHVLHSGYTFEPHP